MIQEAGWLGFHFQRIASVPSPPAPSFQMAGLTSKAAGEAARGHTRHQLN